MLCDLTLILPVPGDDDLPPLGDTTTKEGALQLARRRIAVLARDLDRATLSAERLSWLLCWTRALEIVDLAILALRESLALGMMAASRSALELHMHTRTMLRPALSELALLNRFDSRGDVSDAAWADVLQRLRAYCAWCLANDRIAYQHQIRHLRGIFDPTSTEELLREPERLPTHELLFGPVERVTRDQLRADQKSTEDRLQAEIARIDQWLTDPGLVDWTRQPRFPRMDDSGATNFGAFLGDSELTVGAQLRAADIGFLNTTFAGASGMLHGSTFDGFLVFAEGSAITPRFSPAESARPAPGVASTMTYVALALAMLRPHVWDVS